MTIQSNLDSPQQHHRVMSRYHQHHDPAYNITSAEADEYNSDNSIAVLQHHHRYMPSSSSSCDNTKQHPMQGSSLPGSCDENTPSVLDINLDSKKIALSNPNNSRLNSPARFDNERKYTNHIEIYSDNGNKLEEEISEDDRGPPLPPRPAPRTRTLQRAESAPTTSGVRKYVIWCLICGGISCLLGILFLGIYFLLRSYTSTVGYFETVPTFVPATLLMVTGICIMSLARRRNRYSYLIKLSGACGLASALTCALVTVTTTVLHMSRLQVLRECEYTQKTRTCTCYSVTAEKQAEGLDDNVRFVFDSTSDCGVVHGALYSCLRAVFGLSVAGVLVAVFSCMLVYQLLSHERKKMYWEQLELRCRSLYSGQQGPSVLPSGPMLAAGRNGNCRCCEQCHAHRNVMPSAYPWEGDQRFWTPGQAGNFYSPNPGGEENAGGNRLNQNGRRMPGWSWPRMPWQRNDSQRMSPHSPDSQYGFSNRTNAPEPVQVGTNQPRYNVIEQQYGIWGPPPPYSDPNSPARRGRYQYIHPAQCQPMIEANAPPTNIAILECHQHPMTSENHSIQQFNNATQQNAFRNPGKRQAFKPAKDNYENTPSDSDGPRDRFSNTLPLRKTKKRVEAGAKSIGPNQPAPRVNVQNVFNSNTPNTAQNSVETSENEYNEPSLPNNEASCSGQMAPVHAKTRRIKAGVENTGFQTVEALEADAMNGKVMEPTESEVYFADVSSCCNMSVKNDNYYEDTNQRRRNMKDKNKIVQEQEQFTKDQADDYIAQRFGKREPSVRSRLPFPQIIPETYEKPAVMPRPSLMHKDISRQSMCSVESGEKTDYTDLSPATPSTNFPSVTYPQQDTSNNFNALSQPSSSSGGPTTSKGTVADFATEPNSSNFIASYPYSSNEQSQEAHRRSTKNLQDIFLAPDSQYEVIKESSKYNETTPLTLSYMTQQDMSAQFSYLPSKMPTPSSREHLSFQHQHPAVSSQQIQQPGQHFKPKSPKNLNITPIKRQSLGTNISSIIQNLSSSEAGLLYPEGRNSHCQSSSGGAAAGTSSSSSGAPTAGLMRDLEAPNQQTTNRADDSSNDENDLSDPSDRHRL
ncbi:uncharacterized protein LOC5564953 isoform X1 [Aedes aegypti]|uniref:Uncharacterized protein n=2 Tax=Aedes aegypti TaxID=7159 RepID=A0A6I8TNQ8_AEDAE|nr:uncharacterized protein LOC5564953 isoform X1 [Aedes aegypti]XP_021697670.1 uncharacterized protein LOC5564953 isoform X1 [Aedes aegypti]XP_021697671.1 uncharacterized protein LOC5564953 isoform X1 [Aedes aegypti]XP_021697672.1 uncharacterized protein LOC5564953 isoform X1 [Aedes aegypti]